MKLVILLQFYCCMWDNDLYVNHAVIRSSVNMSMHFTCDQNVLGLQCHIVMYLSKYIELN